MAEDQFQLSCCFSRSFHLFLALIEAFCLESRAGCSMTCAEEREPLAALGGGVLITVFFLCVKSSVSNIAYLKHPRFIQSLDAKEGFRAWQMFAKWKLHFHILSICFQKVKLWLSIPFIFKACSWDASPLDILLVIFLIATQKRLYWIFSSLKVYYQSSF